LVRTNQSVDPISRAMPCQERRAATGACQSRRCLPRVRPERVEMYTECSGIWRALPAWDELVTGNGTVSCGCPRSALLLTSTDSLGRRLPAASRPPSSPNPLTRHMQTPILQSSHRAQFWEREDNLSLLNTVAEREVLCQRKPVPRSSHWCRRSDPTCAWRRRSAGRPGKPGQRRDHGDLTSRICPYRDRRIVLPVFLPRTMPGTRSPCLRHPIRGRHRDDRGGH
jgi:hypothetical protein